LIGIRMDDVRALLGTLSGQILILGRTKSLSYANRLEHTLQQQQLHDKERSVEIEIFMLASIHAINRKIIHPYVIIAFSRCIISVSTAVLL